MTELDPAELPPLNEGTPSLDAPVAVEWWFKFEEDGQPDLDTFHGFHDAEKHLNAVSIRVPSVSRRTQRTVKSRKNKMTGFSVNKVLKESCSHYRLVTTWTQSGR